MAELRIGAGEWRGRRITVPPAGVRPTADRVREAWMSIIHAHLDGARVLDLCAGSGALGLEALSRGAAHCDFVENDPKVVSVLQRNIAALGAEARSTVHRAEATRFIRQLVGMEPDASIPPSPPGTPVSRPPTYHVAFADPPYHLALAESLASLWLKSPFAAIFGVEHEATRTLPAPAGGPGPDRRSYGDTAITIYRRPD